MVLYIFQTKNVYKTKISVLITLMLVATHSLVYFVEDIRYDFIYSIFDILMLIAFALATLSVVVGFSGKTFLIMAPIVGMATEVFSIINLSWHLVSGTYLYLFTGLSRIIGAVVLYIVILLVVLDRKFILPEKRNKNSAGNTLLLLKEKFDDGVITEEEYQVQRQEIISKL